MAKNLFELTIEDLQRIQENDQWPPEGISFEGVANAKDGEQIIRHRNSPAKVSKILLLQKGCVVGTPGVSTPRTITYQGVGKKESIQKPYTPVISTEMREKRLRLKEEELALKKDRLKTSNLLLDELLKLERGQKQILHNQEKMEKALKGLISLILKKGEKNG